MTTVASGVLNGDEARAAIAIVSDDTGVRVELTDMSVPAGAPDTRLYVSPRTDGVIDDTATDLGKIPDGLNQISVDLPTHIDSAQIVSVIIYCKVYSVLFGYGTVTSAN